MTRFFGGLTALKTLAQAAAIRTCYNEVMKVVTLQAAKKHLAKLIAECAEGEEILITQRSLAVAKLVVIKRIGVRRRPGELKGKLHVGPAFSEPLPDGDLRFWNK